MPTILPEPIPAPFVSAPMRVEPGWIDYNGHMNLAYYQVLFDRNLDVVFDALDLGHGYLERTGHSFFAAEVHICYRREVRLEDPVVITWQLLAVDAKRLHFCSQMHHATEGWLASTSENMALHVDMTARRVAPLLPAAQGTLDQVASAHAGLPVPDFVGRRIAMPGR